MIQPLLVGLLLGGCKKNAPCDPADPLACDDGLVCEEVTGGEADCFAPVQVQGRVFDLADNSNIGGARVAALDANGAALSGVAVSAADGSYALVVPSPRTIDGVPTVPDFTLRADAAGFLTYPSGIRVSIPIDAISNTVPTKDSDPWIISNTTTDVGLVQVPAGTGTGSIAGVAEVADDHAGALVVAQQGGAGRTAVADTDGSYVIFNLDDGDWGLAGYALGHVYDGVNVTVSSGQQSSADLHLVGTSPGSASGSVQIVNAPGGSVTSVILVVESTFDPELVRGEAPPGLRAGGVTGSWSISGVPPGDYAVLGAFANDGLVRDPDTSISGTDVLHITVGQGQDVSVDGFKLTGALEVLSPGVDQPEAVSGPVSLSWADDSSEDEYQVVVYDAYGNLAWSATEPRHTGDDPVLSYSGPLEPGMYYWFRATSYKDGTPISMTEDLRGVFYAPGAP